jgi:hypothetical protein
MLLLTPPAAGADLGTEDSLTSVEVHGFVSQGFILTSGNEYLAPGSTRGSFEFSELGINFNKRLTDTLSVGVQLFAQDLGRLGDYKPKLDWYHIDYRWRDWLGLRVGRLKIPYGLHNEIHDVDSARVPILLPGSVYPLQNRDTLFAQTGAELHGFVRMPGLGALDYRLFGGTMFIDPKSLTAPGGGLELQIDVPYVLGGRLLWETPLDGLRLGISIQAFRLETTAFITGIMAPVLIGNDALLWVASAEYALQELMLTAEYARWDTKQRSDTPELSPPLDPSSERAYAMATYRLTPWLHPGAYYSLLFPNLPNREGRENVQHDLAATLRFDINAYWLVKLEGHYMSGTAGLENPIRTGPSNIATAEPRWGAFFLKTTGYF